MTLLEVYLPDGQVKRLELDKSNLTVGRSPQADLRIDDPEISRLHARLDKINENRWVVTDLDSRNETYFQGRAVKSHTLTHLDTFYFGSIQIIFQDPSGNSDKKINRTIYKETSEQPVAEVQENQTPLPRRPKGVMLEPPVILKKSPIPAITPIEKKFACPLCKADMSTTDIVCTRCGYNLRTGEAMEIEVDEDETVDPDEGKDQEKGEGEGLADLGFETTDSNASTTAASMSPKLKRKPDADIASIKPIFISKQWQLFIDWWLPIGIFVLAVLLILGIEKPVHAGITLVSIIFRIVLMLFTMAVATKAANFQMGCFWDALVKILATTSTIALFEIPNPVFGIVASLVILIGFIKLFFNPDLFGWMLTAILMFFLNTFLIANFMVPQLRNLFK